jgi:uncharacterized protein YeeX (DUF496 family)
MFPLQKVPGNSAGAILKEIVMKIYINNTIEVTLDAVKDAISYSEAKELIKNFSYEDEFLDDLVEIAGLNESDHISYISDRYMNKYINDNINYYDATAGLKRQITRLSEELEKCKDKLKNNITGIPDNKSDAKRFFCDLLDISYYTNSKEIVEKIFDLIDETGQDYREQVEDELYDIYLAQSNSM